MIFLLKFGPVVKRILTSSVSDILLKVLMKPDYVKENPFY